MSSAALRTLRPAQNIPYSIQRNARGSLPVYTDIRNGRTRYHVLLKNVKGDIEALKGDLQSSLLQNGSEAATRLKMEVKRGDTLIISGGRFKHTVMEWLQSRGF